MNAIQIETQTKVPFRTLRVPAIGAYWHGQGGIYAGIVRGKDGTPDYHLIVGPEAADEMTWDDANGYAITVAAEGHSDFVLPNQRDDHVAQANVSELFKPKWYWLSEQHASFSDDAWFQFFIYGYQFTWNKGYPCRVRLVRRLAV
jgi:hypothetical protein